MPAKLKPQFTKADSTNLKLILIYRKMRSSRENYGDAAIGYVCLKRENAICTIRVRIYLEHRVKQKEYTVII